MTFKRLAIGAIVLVLSSSMRAQCGAERRDIKSGFDPAAAGIVVDNPTATTIETITGIPQPNPIPPSTRVSPAETTAWTLDAMLEAFKLEGGPKGDHDYHLVLHDDAGRQMIAEIPSPDCVGQGTSAFRAQITKARSDFDAQFSVTTGFQTVNQRVRVTGIGMFDFSHGQRGYAANGVELHPVLAIEFNPTPGTPVAPPEGSSGITPPAPVSSAGNLLSNGGFENGDSNPAPWKASAGVISNQNDEIPHSGEWKAWLGGLGSAHTDHLYQDVEIPSSASNATLLFYLHIVTAESEDHPYDTLAVQVRDISSHVLGTLATFSNVDANVAYEKRTFDLSSYKGTKIRIYFSAREDQGRQTSFVLDDVVLATQ